MEIFGLRYIIPSGFLFLPFILATIKFEITYAHVISLLDNIALESKNKQKDETKSKRKCKEFGLS